VIELIKMDQLDAFLNLYISRYSDYATVLLRFPDYYEYNDICFDTADTLFNVMAGNLLSPNVHYTEILPYLLQNTVIEGSVDTSNQCHGFVLIPVSQNKVYVVQSLGGIYSAFIKTFTVDALMIELTKLENGDTMELFDFVDVDAKDIDVTYKVAIRKNITIDLLPDLNKDEKLKELRKEYILHMENYRKGYVRSLGLLLGRKSDAKSAIVKMSM
jgi:hypothetical protein